MGKIVIFAFWVVCMVLIILIFLKGENALKNQIKILNAIDSYGEDTGKYLDVLRMIDNMESSTRTIFRLWDWGYENILPQEDFEVIKPYIK